MSVTRRTRLRTDHVGGHLELVEDLCDVIDGDEHRVPAGFPSDGASIPRVFAWLFPRHSEKRMRAAFHHDYDYSKKRDRKRADRLFYARLIIDGEQMWRAWLMYRAVRMFGGRAWSR